MSDQWMATTLGEIAEIVGGGTPSTKELKYWGGDIVWLTEVVRADGQRIATSERTITSEGLTQSSAKLLPAGAVLVTTRASVGFVALADRPLATNQGFQSLVPMDCVLSEFLMLWVQANREEFTSRAGGSTFPEVSKSKVATIPVNLPPLVVQRRIVDLMAHIDNHLVKLRSEHDAASGVLVRMRATLMGPADEWKAGRLDQVAEIRLGRMLSKERSSGDYLAPYIRNANVQWDALNLSDLKQMSFPAKERETYALRAGDILVCEGGDPGRAVLLEEDLPGIYYQKAVHRVRCSGVVDAGFLYQWIACCYQDQRIEDLCTNTTIKHLTAEKFRTLEVRYPPIDDQIAIVRILEAASQVKASLNAELAALLNLRSGLLQGLLSAELTVPSGYDSFLVEVA
jgi:type I restriction enzyme S subunit